MEEAREVLTEFLKAWKRGDWDTMYLNCQKTWMLKRYPIEVAWEVGEDLPVKYRISRFREISEVVAEAVVWIYWAEGKRLANVRLIKEIDAYKPRKSGGWGVNPVSILRYAE